VSWRGSLRRGIPYLIALGGGFLLAYLVVALFVFPSGVIPQDQRVPNVIGLPYTDAATQLQQVGFAPQRGEQRFHGAAPRGTVVEQTPPPGSTEAAGAMVTLVVSAGERTASIPGVIGMSREQAISALESAGFTIGMVSERPSNEPAGAVIDSRPRPGAQTRVPSPVSLILSAGPTVVIVPDVVGRPLDDAKLLLQQLGLVVGDVTWGSGGAAIADASAVVIFQSPPAGSQTVARSRVNLTLGSRTP
jgi:eukaryotic-like serine/threonine-protein kinase